MRIKLLLTVAYSTLSCGLALAAAQDTKPSSVPSSAQQHSVLKAVAEPFRTAIPRVWLSAGHSKQCKIGVGESFPTVRLPNLGGAVTDLASLRGKQATVVLFWHPDRWMSRSALVDMQRDVAKKFDAEKVSMVGVAVHQEANSLHSLLGEANVEFPQLIDAGGEALSKVGTFALPRIYVLDSEGTIVWFDLEYSEATRRELKRTLDVLTAE